MTLPKLRDLSLCVTEYQRTLDEGWNMCVREMETHLNAAKGEADEVVCEVMAVVRDSDDGPYLEFTGEGGLHDIPEGTHVWLLSGGECQPENGWMSLYTRPASSDVVREADAVSSDELCRLLPGPYYMDPPDGGDLPLVEQLKRMAIDAARYRWLRNEAIHYENQATRTPWVFNAKNVADYDGWPVWDQELDKLVDAGEYLEGDAEFSVTARRCYRPAFAWSY